MSEKITKSLYGGEVKIDFFPESHRYKLAGEKTYLISATACTGIIDKSRFLIPWAVNLAGTFLRQYFENASCNQFTTEELLPVVDEALKQHTVKKEEAASIGDQVHDWVEQFAKAKIEDRTTPDVDDKMSDQVANGVIAFLKWYEEHEVKFLESERMVYSRAHGFVGITDAIVEIEGKKILLDYKTGKGIYNEFYYQVAGYRLAYEEENGKLDGAMIIHFDKETGNFNLKDISDEEHAKNYPVFLACLAIKQREKELTKY